MILIKVEHGKNLFPKLDTIKASLASNSNKSSVTFESGKVDENYRKFLQNELERHFVDNNRFQPILWIRPAIETIKIQEVLDLVHSAAVSFRDDGNRIMKILGETYEVNPFIKRELNKVRIKSRVTRQRGRVNEDWNFWFHGAECRFDNHKTGQIVELDVTYGSEFGALDSYFFLRYMNTTSQFKSLANFFNDDKNSVSKALIMLEDQGRLERIDNHSHRGIVVK